MFIKNNVFERIEEGEIDSLLKNTSELIAQINKANNLTVNEIQFDCDWTEKTKASYFYFLNTYRSEHKITISATIRLHQVKYRVRSGIPPVKKGVLMYYNMGQISADSANSIYDSKAASKYIAWLKNYPLPLDVALPIFSWGIHIRDHKVAGLLNKVNASDFEADNFFIKRSTNVFVAQKSEFKNGYYFAENDVVKIEKVNGEQLIDIAGALRYNLTHKPARIIFYDIDSVNLKRYDEKIFKQIHSIFN